MAVIVGEGFFPLYGSTQHGSTQLDGDNAAVPATPTERGARPRRLCPIRPGPEGRLIIDWDTGTFHSGTSTSPPKLAGTDTGY